MGSFSDEKLPSLLEKFHRDITLWIPKRKATIEELQQVVDSINKTGKLANQVKCAGSSVSAASGIFAGILGVVALFSTGGLAAPLVVAGTLVSVAGVGGAVASGGADVVKAVKLPKLYEESTTSKFKKESDYYMTVIEQAAQLHHVITDKSKLSSPDTKINAKINTARIVVNLLGTYSSIHSLLVIKIADAASTAAAEAAAIAILKSSIGKKLPTIKALTDASSDVIKVGQQLFSLNAEGIANGGHLFGRGIKYAKSLLGGNKALAIECATEAAEIAAHSTKASVFVSKGTTQAIAKAAGKTAGEAAEAIVKAGTKEGIQAVAKKATTPAAKAAKAAGKTIFAESAEATAKATGEAVAKSTGSSLKAAGNAVMKALPLLNFGFAAWDTYEAAKAGYEITHGTEQEKLLREKIQELKEQANEIVVIIYNYLADLQSPKLPHIEIPFPECKI